MDRPPVSISLKAGYCLLFALLPWSIDVDLGDWNLTLPSEPLILTLGLALIPEAWRRRETLWQLFRRNALPGLVLAWLLWMGISAAASPMPAVAFKYWLVEAGHCWVFGLGLALFPGIFRRAFPWLALSLAGVAVYTLARHAGFDFRSDQALLAPMPFFPDHNMYAAVLVTAAFYVAMPALEWPGAAARFRRIGVVLAAFFAAATVVSSSRGAALSLLAAAALFWLGRQGAARPYFSTKGTAERARISVICGKIILTGLLLAAAFLLAPRVRQALARDVSFQERFNRWDCARQMLDERPLTGYGPGVYPFAYHPFQQPEKMTRISSTAPITERGPATYGRGGGAHSEYVQAAAELGRPGFALWIALVLTTLFAARRKPLLWAGLAAFFIHALVNNFLHDGRVAALVWGGLGLLIRLRNEDNV